MRPLEIVMPILLIIYLLWPMPRPVIIAALPSSALIVALIHFTLEGYRWQMVPLYALTLTLAGASVMMVNHWTILSTRTSRLLVVILLASVVLPILLPVPKIPAPGGPYPVGTKSMQFTDTSRKEIYSGKDEPRRFMAQVWYPAAVAASAEHAHWMSSPDIYAPAIATFLGLPSFFLDHLALAVSPAYLAVPAADNDQPFPVVLFSHGWKGFNAQNTGQAVELASHGFVVVAVQHTYGAIVTVFPDGTVANNNPDALPADDEDPNYEVVARKLVDQWAGDLAFVVDQFESFNTEPGDVFFHKLDMNRLGVYGHSTGGGAAIQFCGTDPRCKAVLGMDPFMRPVSVEVIENGLSRPSFFMFSQAWAELTASRNNQLFNAFSPNLQENFGEISISGTKHFDFSDLPLLSPIAPQLGLKGPLNGRRVTTIVNTYLLGFFELTLQGEPSRLFSGSFADFVEVKVR